MSYTICVEGNIGAGKSTLLQYLQDNTNCQVIWEPINKWTNLNGNNLLDLWYKDPEKYSMSFQSYIQLTMLQNHLVKATSRYKVLERSIFSAQHCFIANLKNNNIICNIDHTILNEWYNMLIDTNDIKVDLFVYLKTSPKDLYARIKHRNRPEEENITLEYLTQIHQLHEKWLGNNQKANVLVVDASRSLASMTKQYRDFQGRF